jgi:DNA-binding response OmpR family regulator
VKQILIVEDDPRISSFLSKGLRAGGYDVSCLADGNELMATIEKNHPDLILLDLGLPGRDGMELLSELRGQGTAIPIIILSARDELDDRVNGLEQGANDYIIKPFRFAELLARVNVQMREQHSSRFRGPSALDGILLHGPGGLILDLRSHQVHGGEAGAAVALSQREFSILELLMRNPNQPLSRELILETVWGYSHDPGSNVVDVYIRYLRRKIGADRILTIRGFGYQLVAP